MIVIISSKGIIVMGYCFWGASQEMHMYVHFRQAVVSWPHCFYAVFLSLWFWHVMIMLCSNFRIVWRYFGYCASKETHMHMHLWPAMVRWPHCLYSLFWSHVEYNADGDGTGTAHEGIVDSYFVPIQEIRHRQRSRWTVNSPCRYQGPPTHLPARRTAREHKLRFGLHALKVQ